MIKQFSVPKGATPIDDVSGLIPTWVHDLRDLNRVEAENILLAQRKYLQGAVPDPKQWFQIGQLRSIHRAMFGQVWQWAGNYRTSKTSIGVAPHLISSQCGEFCSDVMYWLTNPVELTFLEMAARIHHRLVLIHPFENGNGRCCRLIADRFLLALKCPYPIWPDQLNRDGLIRRDYILMLQQADRGNYDPLIGFMRRLGARDPTCNEFIENKFYSPYLHQGKGDAFLKAYVRLYTLTTLGVGE